MLTSARPVTSVKQYMTVQSDVTTRLRHRYRVLSEVVDTERAYVNNLYNCLKVRRALA